MGALAARAAIAQHAEAGLVHRISGGEPLLEAPFVQRAHPRAGRLIVHRPQAHDHGPGARHLEGAAQAEDTLAGLDLADAGVAGREDGPFDALEIERRHFFRGQDAILLVGASLRTAVCAGQGQAGERSGFWAAAAVTSQPADPACAAGRSANAEKNPWWRGAGRDGASDLNVVSLAAAPKPERHRAPDQHRPGRPAKVDASARGPFRSAART
jgi:hypothetical protein